jgi:hypothetical protein
MPQIQINEQTFQAARRRAKDGGFTSVEAYLADLIAQDVANEAEGYGHIFTAELLAHLDKISRKIKAGGKTYTMAEVKGLLASNGEEL